MPTSIAGSPLNISSYSRISKVLTQHLASSAQLVREVWWDGLTHIRNQSLRIVRKFNR